MESKKSTKLVWFYMYAKQSVCESQREGFWEEKEQTWGCVYLCPHGASAMCALCGSHEDFREYERKEGGGKRDEQCSLVHCTLSAVLPLACFVRRRPLWNPLRNGKSGPSETTTQTPYSHTSSSVPPNPWQQRRGQEGSGAREKRGGALKKRSARFSGSRIQAPWPRAAWMRSSVFSSSAHFHLDVSEWTVQMSAGEWQAVKDGLKRGRKETTEYRGPNRHEHFKNVLREKPACSKFALLDLRRLNNSKSCSLLVSTFPQKFFSKIPYEKYK